MNITVIKKIPTAEEIIQMYPLSEAGHKQIIKDRQEVRDIIAGRDNRLLLIVGPCSAWPSEAVLEYAAHLKNISDEVKEKFKIVMRAYIQKPRTTRGWTGPINQPDPFQPPDISKGIKYCRNLMTKIIELGLPIADEALFTHNTKGFIDLLSWAAVGARSVEDQEHRILASAVECPVGMKNSTTGSIEVAVNGILAAQFQHHIVFSGYHVETNGNRYAHLVLRGKTGSPNYGAEHLHEASALFEKNKIQNPAILIDASHDNCCINGIKDCTRQGSVVKEVLSTIDVNQKLKKLVKGFMVESFIKTGNQKIEASTSETIDRAGLSITDPCLGWEETKKLIRDMMVIYDK